MTTIRLTNLLGSVLGAKEFQYDPSKKTIVKPVSKQVFYTWEAQLAQCAFLSRLVYAPTELFLRGIQFIDYAPDVVNDIITQLEHSFYSKHTFYNLFLSENVPSNATVKHGMFFPRTGCAMFHNHTPTSNINKQKTLYVVFKGSSSIRDFKNDLALLKTAFSDIPELTGLEGTTHGGFYKHMREEIAYILKEAIALSSGVERVIVTGHSLGGAMSTLFSLMLARAKETGVSLPDLHCVTFGAPNLFSDDARNSFNKYLLNGTLTYDRVTAESKGMTGALLKAISALDIITILPGAFFSHPGFSILKTELYATSKTGRASDIDDIRNVFLGQENVIRRKGAGAHELPADPVFWNLFTPWKPDNATPLETRLQNYGQMKRYKNPDFVKFVLQDIKPDEQDIQPVLTEKEEKEADNEEAKIVEQETKEMAKNASSKSSNSDQSGGALTLSTSKSASNYKKQTLSQFPNRINYQCYKRLSGGFCHAAYMGIGFMGGIRAPVLRYRDDKGVMRTKFIRKQEPTEVTKFVGISNAMNPQIRYYAVPNDAKVSGGSARRLSSRLGRNKRTMKRSMKRSIKRSMKRRN